MMNDNTLFLTINKEPFDQILSGKKRNEYRKISPRYESMFAKKYKFVVLQNGYRPDSRRLRAELKTIIRQKHRFVLKLGAVKLIQTKSESCRTKKPNQL